MDDQVDPAAGEAGASAGEVGASAGEVDPAPDEAGPSAGEVDPAAHAPAADGADDRALGVRQLRLVVTTADFERALRFYRDVLGMPEAFAVASEGGRVAILDAGRATLELADPPHAAHIDELEVGRRTAGHIRVALQVDDAQAMTNRLAEAGATVLAPPVPTPWGSLNSRLEAPAELQLTLFQGQEE